MKESAFNGCGWRPVLLGPMLVLLMMAAEPPASAAALYNEATYRDLAADRKAYRVGDAITIHVFESSSAVTNLDTTTRRKNGLSAALSREEGDAAVLEAAVGGDFDGGGRTQRTGRLLAQLSATVQEILPNGEMRLAGEQRLTVNDEVQRISIEGRIRPQDISDGNVVLSTRLADARIVYVGDGDLSERQRRSVWRKFADWIGF